MISSHGQSNSPLILLSDGAYEADLKNGYALSGYAGEKLNSLCKANGLHFDNFWKSALIKEKIHGTKWEPNEKLLSDHYKNIFKEELQTVSPNIVVPLGELSFRHVSGLENIRKFRGSVLPSSPIFQKPFKVIPILSQHPYFDQDPKLEVISRLDFSKVARYLEDYGPIKEEGTVWIAKTAESLREFLNRHYEKAKFVVFDIETYFNIPTCMSFCFDGHESVCVPFLDRSIPIDLRVLMFQLCCRVLASPIPKVNQNIKFDWRKLERIGVTVNNVVGDTMLAASCIYCEFPKNLGFLTSIYTDMPYFKDEGKELQIDRRSPDKFYLYNAKDSLATHQIYTKQQEELTELGVNEVYRQLITILPIYKQMEDNGIRIDDERRRQLLSKYECLYEIGLLTIEKLIGRPFNPLSSTKTSELVYDELKFKVIRGIHRTKKGMIQADEDSLELLIWQSTCNAIDGKAILRRIIDCRKLHKCIELLSLDAHPDGRFRCEFNLAGAETGRTTAGETTDYYLYFNGKKIGKRNLGHSFQTIGKHGFTVDGEIYGKDLRSMFVPSPGYVFVECDLSQAEARVDAILAKDFDILKVFDSPTGIHRLTASWFYNCEPSQITKEIVFNEQGVGEDRYFIGKTGRHAAERNMKEERLMIMIRRPLPECAKILKTFHTKQPNIREVFHREVREALRKSRSLVAPNGRRRDFFGRMDSHTENEAISFLPQAIVTDYLKQSLKKTYDETCEFARPLSEAHDGFLAEVEKGREEEYGRIFKRNIEVSIDFRRCSLSRDFNLVIPCEVSVGENWKEMREIKI